MAEAPRPEFPGAADLHQFIVILAVIAPDPADGGIAVGLGRIGDRIRVVQR